MPGMAEWIMIAAIGLLIFGKRLPEVGRSLGKGIVEFKKGLAGIEEQVHTSTTQVDQPKLDQQAKFDPYTGKPLQAKFDPYTGKPLTSDSNTSSS
jgi:sec-independent protein translocase protein TatA